MIPYKHTGKAATYKVQVDLNKNAIWGEAADLGWDIVLKANAYSESNFEVP